MAAKVRLAHPVSRLQRVKGILATTRPVSPTVLFIEYASGYSVCTHAGKETTETGGCIKRVSSKVLLLRHRLPGVAL